MPGLKSTLVKLNTGAKPLARLGAQAGISALRVNNRSISTATGGFSSGGAVSERIEMRRLQSKLGTAAYKDNEMARRRLQQKVATQASELYGMDRSKLTKHWQGTAASGLSNTVRTVDTGSGAQMLADKVNLGPPPVVPGGSMAKK
jgi:hypothetical protein